MSGRGVGVASLVSVILSGLALVALFLGAFMPAGSMSTDQNDCKSADPCERIQQSVTWTLQREKIEIRTVNYSSPEAQAAGSPTRESVDTFSTPWSAHGHDAASAMTAAGVLSWVAIGVTVLGAALVLVGRFTHMAVGIVGGVLGIVVLFLVGAAVLQAWSNGIDPLGGAIKDGVADPEHNWATSGPFFGAGLIVLGVGGLLALVAGIIGVVPAGYED